MCIRDSACRSDAAAIKNGHIVNGFMFEHGNVDALLKEQREKTYYMPEKEELLRYEAVSYTHLIRFEQICKLMFFHKR